ncbi:Myb-like DNA-binding domain containing protein [Tritrichomonas foetus]|uniref:Myb-like DNA-binding domain containing protein n=1 Tax=Tritrichomonas foetus TaxID=1144522 RepID=A0A1J4KT82_9EUKA|nr:Myb-like DNA-binding domain containing protein [Tritrichomonas foetus]|eukprot:OHT14495.1 Myb-like DNA-binding domain containing protein [Tritrichomonas foetus]
MSKEKNFTSFTSLSFRTMPKKMNKNVIQTTFRTRIPFSHEEDLKLRELVSIFGENNKWKLISAQMPSRSTRQVRERWQLFLSSNILKEKWSKEEDAILKEKYQEFGSKWKLLEVFFPGRTSYTIRNRWISLQKREKLQKETSSQESKRSNSSGEGNDLTFDDPENEFVPFIDDIFGDRELMDSIYDSFDFLY